MEQINYSLLNAAVQAVEMSHRRNTWKHALTRLEKRFGKLMDAKPGRGMFGARQFDRLLVDILPEVSKITNRERMELIRFTADKFPALTVQSFKGWFEDKQVSDLVTNQRPRGLVVVGYSSGVNMNMGPHTIIYTSDPTASMLVALLFTPEK